MRPLLALILYAGFLYLFRIPYACYPYDPTESCELGKYHVSLRSIEREDQPVIATALAECVYKSGRRLILENGSFMSEQYERLEVPAKQAEVCQVR